MDNKIMTLESKIKSKRGLLKTIPEDARHKVEKNIRKMERKLERMTTCH